MLGALAVAGCGEQDSSGVAQEPASSETPTPTETPTPSYEPPELDRSELDANLAALSPGDRALVDHYLHAKGDDRLGEGTWIVAAPLTVAEAKERLLGPGAQPVTAADLEAVMDFDESAYAFLQVGDGVVAWEDTGFADPPKRLLAALSEGGAVSAVATDNIEAMTRSDPEGPMVELATWSAVAQAMSEKVTGVRATPTVQAVDEWYAVPVPWA